MALAVFGQLSAYEALDQEAQPTRPWRELVDELAPKPPEDPDSFNPISAIRYAVARYVIEKDVPIPDELRSPANQRTVKVILSEIAGITDLPADCGKRHLELQMELNPHVAKTVAAARLAEQRAAREKELIEQREEELAALSERNIDYFYDLRDTTADRNSWPGEPACVDADPELFHVSITTAQRLKGVDDVEVFKAKFSEALEFCAGCPVVEECLEAGIRDQDSFGVPIIAGGHYINAKDGQLIDLLNG